MSYGNAVRQREEMLAEYERMLKLETDPTRISDIETQIMLVKDQISQLKVGKPLFGKPKPLKMTTTLIEPDPEKPGEQIVTVLNAPPSPAVAVAEEGSSEPPQTPAPKRLGNNLRNKRKSLQASLAENSLKAQIEAAKAASGGKQTV